MVVMQFYDARGIRRFLIRGVVGRDEELRRRWTKQCSTYLAARWTWDFDMTLQGARRPHRGISRWTRNIVDTKVVGTFIYRASLA